MPCLLVFQCKQQIQSTQEEILEVCRDVANITSRGSNRNYYKITEQVFGKPVFVINYPKEIKSFYMRLNDDGKTVAAMDMLVPGVGEIIGGSQREERLDVLLARMEECNLKEEDYWWYVNLRKYGGTKHAGYGLGFERIIMYLTGVSNIRDVIPYPRTVGNAEY